MIQRGHPRFLWGSGGVGAEHNYRLSFLHCDLIRGQMKLQQSHVEELLAFLTLWSRAAPILIHCRAGISRSTATAFITACLHNPQADEWEIARTLRRAAPYALPNQRLIALADEAMRRGGRMS